MTGVGLDASFLGRIDLTLDFYNIINSELLLNVPLSPSTGFFDQTANAGKVRNRGFEIALNTTNVKTRGVTWTTGFNIGFNRNSVLTYADSRGIPPVERWQRNRLAAGEGGAGHLQLVHAQVAGRRSGQRRSRVVRQERAVGVHRQAVEYTLAGMYSTPYPVGRTFMFGVDLTF